MRWGTVGRRGAAGCSSEGTPAGSSAAEGKHHPASPAPCPPRGGEVLRPSGPAFEAAGVRAGLDGRGVEPSLRYRGRVEWRGKAARLRAGV